jgi:hypothetical protein
MKKNILVTLILIANANIYAQYVYSGSAITANTYFHNPAKYLSKLDTSKIKSKVLIDRSMFDSGILKVNGTNLVTTISTYQWRKMYKDLKNANIDTSFLPNLAILQKDVKDFSRWDNLVPIGILHFDFKQIEPTSINNGAFAQDASYLREVSVTPNSYLIQKAFAASCMADNIYGDNINFIIPSWLYITNTNQKITAIDVDFGNGEGYKSVTLDQPINITYSSNCENIQIVVRVNLRNAPVGQSTLYSHSTIYRKGTSAVPLPSIIQTENNPNAGSVPYPKFTAYYPVGNNAQQLHCYNFELDCHQTQPITVEKLEYSFLFNPLNPSRKLRRPFIMCDGFDYNDQRNYFCDNSTNDSPLPMEKDYRGLYEMVNGDMSPWSINNNESSGKLIPALLADGYDLVFVNFLDGAGDVFSNATAMRGFLNDVINKKYRDNKTEEAIIVGPSMGGLVTRMAITQMEQAVPVEEHYIKTWISFDSPHKGANISISLQHSIKYASEYIGIGDNFLDKLEAINSKCAKQLVLFHYSQTGLYCSPADDHTILYNALDDLGFPKFSKNYGITNGGLSNLYSPEAQKIVNFQFGWLDVVSLDGWGAWNSSNSSTIFKGSGWGSEEERQTQTRVALDNGAGGWMSALYSLNEHFLNVRRDDNDENTFPTNRACFIPLPSALGCNVTSTSVKSNWTGYTNINDNLSGLIKTPFDEIHGMINNEEHVRISPLSKNYVITEFRKNMTKTVRPVVRAGAPINQQVSGKVAYTIKDTISFGNTGNGNTFTFNPGADVNITAGKTTNLLDGFIAKAGSEIHIKTSPITTSTVLYSAVPDAHKKDDEREKKPFDYTKPSSYLGKAYDYSEKNNVRLLSASIVLNISPNPTSGEFNFTISGLNGGNAKIEIYNTIGEMVISENIFSAGTYNANIFAFESGIYLLKVVSDVGEVNQKIIKL